VARHHVGFLPMSVAAAVAFVVDLVVVDAPSGAVFPELVVAVAVVAVDDDDDGGDENEGEGSTAQHQHQPASKDALDGHATISNGNASDAADTSAIVVVVQRYPSAEYFVLLAPVLVRVPFLCPPSQLYPLFLGLGRGPFSPVYVPSPFHAYTHAFLHSQEHTIPPPPRPASAAATEAAANDDAASPFPVLHADASADVDAGAANGNDDDPSLHPFPSPFPSRVAYNHHHHHHDGDDGALLDAHVHAAVGGGDDDTAVVHPKALDQEPTTAEEEAAAVVHTRHVHVGAHDTPHYQVVVGGLVLSQEAEAEEAQNGDVNAHVGGDVDVGVLLHAAYAHVREEVHGVDPPSFPSQCLDAEGSYAHAHVDADVLL